MIIKNLLTAVAAASLAAAPTMAAAQASAPTELAPAAESAEGSDLRGGFLLPLVGVVAIIIAILVFVDDDEPESP